jgi:hypothetical protein
MAQLANGKTAERESMRFPKRPQPLNCLAAFLNSPSAPFILQSLERLQNHILGILERATIETALDESFHLGLRYLDGHVSTPINQSTKVYCQPLPLSS